MTSICPIDGLALHSAAGNSKIVYCKRCQGCWVDGNAMRGLLTGTHADGAARVRYPVGRRANAYPKLRRYRAHASPRANRLNELAATLLDRMFLAITVTYRNPRTLQHARARYDTRGQIRRPAAPRALARGRNSGRPAGSLHFSRTMHFEHSVFN